MEVPEALRHCADMPKRPSGNYSQREVREFIVRLNEARKDCKAKLAELGSLIDKQNENAIKLRNERNKK